MKRGIAGRFSWLDPCPHERHFRHIRDTGTTTNSGRPGMKTGGTLCFALFLICLILLGVCLPACLLLRVFLCSAAFQATLLCRYLIHCCLWVLLFFSSCVIRDNWLACCRASRHSRLPSGTRLRDTASHVLLLAGARLSRRTLVAEVRTHASLCTSYGRG